MRTMTDSEFRAKFAEVLSSVVDDCDGIVITRTGHEPAVIISLDEYNTLKEAAYLMRSPANARRLMDSIERLERGERRDRSVVGAE